MCFELTQNINIPVFLQMLNQISAVDMVNVKDHGSAVVQTPL